MITSYITSMLFSIANLKKQTSILRLVFSVGFLYSLISLVPYLANSEEIATNCLPYPPDTGTLQNPNSRPAGTRDNHCQTLCGEPGGQITYLLGNKNREYTDSTHATFWFHIPQNIEKVKQVKFVLSEDATGKNIYERSIKVLDKTGFIGIAIPPEEKYAMSPNINYSWNLHIDCQESNEDAVVVLKGGIFRLPSNNNIQKFLTATAKEDRYQIYLQNNLLYNALDEIARLRVSEPNNSNFKAVWNQFLKELGQDDLIKKEAAPVHLLKTQILGNNNNK